MGPGLGGAGGGNRPVGGPVVLVRAAGQVGGRVLAAAVVQMARGREARLVGSVGPVSAAG